MERPSVLFLVNGEPGSAMGVRARSFAERLESDFRIRIAYRSSKKLHSTLRFFWLLLRLRPALCYVLDLGFSGVLAAALFRILSRCRMVVDTGDAIYELSRSTGSRGRLGLGLTRMLEWIGLSASHRLVVRSHPHQQLLRSRGIAADVIPDGVDTKQFCPRREDELRRRYNLQGVTVVGVLGSLIWNPRQQMCYGWELIELIDTLRDQPVKGLVIGDGSGLKELKEQCAARGIADRITFVGRVPYNNLPQFINLMDICLSTQTNNTAGQVRTTGKLPLYLACGRFVLASQVGEAARVLPPEMLIAYNGVKDTEYPGKLASRIQCLLKDPRRFEQPETSVLIAQTYFDYNILAAQLRNTLSELLPPGFGGRQQEIIASPPPAKSN
jgi:glycosyltransferase involved in cell wall biosynthesis